MREFLRYAGIAVIFATVISCAQAIAEDVRSNNDRKHATSTEEQVSPLASSMKPYSSNGTCSSRTINYVTHNFPQQCLGTDKVSALGACRPTSGTHSALASTSSHGNALTSHSSGSVAVTATVSSEMIELTSTVDQGTDSRSEASLTSGAATNAPASDPSFESASDAESDSPLDNAKFLSFEEWKKLNLEISGQSPKHLSHPRNIPTAGRMHPEIKDALDSLGEEHEIDLDFIGFRDPAGAGSVYMQVSKQASFHSLEESSSEQPSTATNILRSKDAGKTCKERTNYASFDCAATILKSNPECRSASSVLVENKDSYMLNTCSATNKFFIVELCNDILIDTVVLANYEFFSSSFRSFRVSVSDRYPVKLDKWRDLGTFEARNTREVQAFLVENPLIWARYLRIEFLSHYGNEYYCPVSLVRVHGKTMMQEFRQQEELARGELRDEEQVLEPEVAAIPDKEQMHSVAAAEMEEVRQEILSNDTSNVKSDNLPAAVSAIQHISGPVILENDTTTCPMTSSTAVLALSRNLTIPSFSEMTCAHNRGINNVAHPSESVHMHSEASSTPGEASGLAGPSLTSVTHSNAHSPANCEEVGLPSAPDNSYTAINDTTDIYTAESGTAANGAEIAWPSPWTESNNTSTDSKEPNNNMTATNSTIATAPSNSTISLPSGSTSAQQAHPTTQESFFQSIHKRLQQLESNSTLSLQYIEDQSRILRDAFSKVEKRQVTATELFLSHLNETVVSELHSLRQAYDQLWESTVIELEGQREQYQDQILALSTRLTLVANELLWQKRMSIVQSTLLLLCLGLVLFARQTNSYLEVPLLQQATNKSQAALRSGLESPLNSVTPDNRSPVSLLRRKLWPTNTDFDNGHMTDESGSRSRPQTRDEPDVHLELPTPLRGVKDTNPCDVEDSEHDAAGDAERGSATPEGSRLGLRRPPS